MDCRKGITSVDVAESILRWGNAAALEIVARIGSHTNIRDYVFLSVTNDFFLRFKPVECNSSYGVVPLTSLGLSL